MVITSYRPNWVLARSSHERHPSPSFMINTNTMKCEKLRSLASPSAPAIRFVLRKFGCMSAADDEISILEEEQEPENSIFEAQQDSAAAVAARNQSE